MFNHIYIEVIKVTCKRYSKLIIVPLILCFSQLLFTYRSRNF